MKTEAWWVCNSCQQPVQKVKKGGGSLESSGGHRTICPEATYSIKQVPQQKKKI